MSSSVNMSIEGSKSVMKQHSMQSFNCTVRDYKQNRTDTHLAGINRQLQLILSYASDISIFDPNTSATCEFFSNVYELFTMLDANSHLLWSCVKVLNIACKNRAAHYEMMNTYQFLPHLARMLHDQLTHEKKICILTIIHDLSCGIHIHLITPSIEHLMAMILKWIDNKESELIVMLSLGVLVNLCFNNKPVLFALLKSVNMKVFSKSLLTLTSKKVQNFAAKLLIILDNAERVSEPKTTGELLDITLISIKDAYHVKDHLALRQHIEFYLGIQNEDICAIVYSKSYLTVIQSLLKDAVQELKSSEDDLTRAAESNSLLLRFFSAVIGQDLPGVHTYYMHMASFALDWIVLEMCTADALNLLKSLLAAPPFVQVNNQAKKPIMDKIVAHICLMAAQLNLGPHPSIAKCRMYNDFFDLLKYLLRCETTREHVVAQLKQEQFDHMFDAIVNNSMDGTCNYSQEVLNVYMNALNAVSIAGELNPTWRAYRKQVYEQKQACNVLALGLVSGRRECRVNALEILGGGDAPSAPAIAVAMDRIVAAEGPAASVPATPLTRPETHGKLSDVLQTLRAGKDAGQLPVDVCEIMQLYEDRIAIGEQATEASAACIARLQHQLARLQVVLQRTRTLHLRAEEQLAALRGERKERMRLQEDIEKMMMEAVRKDERTAALERQLKEAHVEHDTNIKQLHKMTKLEMEKNKGLQVELQAAKAHGQETKSILDITQKALQERSEELERALRDCDHYRHLMEGIKSLMHNQK